MFSCRDLSRHASGYLDHDLPQWTRLRAILLTPLVLAMPALVFTSLAANAQTPATGPVLEEIIVTAQKREQPLQEVSLSMDVLRGGELDMLRSSARDILFLAARSPSLYAESSSGRTFPR